MIIRVKKVLCACLNSMSSAIRCLGILLVFVVWTAACPRALQRQSFSPQEIVALLNSKNAAELNKVYAQSQRSFVSAVAYAYRAYELKLPQSEDNLFRALPHSTEDTRQLYELTVANPPEGRDKLTGLYDGYYKAVFDLAPRHPQVFSRLFAVAANFGHGMNEGEGQWFCDLLHHLYKKDPERYLHALAQEPRYRQTALVCAAGCTDTGD